MDNIRIGITRRNFLKTSAIAGMGLAGVSLAGCERASTATNLGIMNIGDCATHFVAVAQGYYEEENITVEPTAFKGGALIAAAIAGGSVDMGWSNVASIILAYDQGFDYQYVAPGADQITDTHAVHRVMVMPNSGITRASDLAGKTFGVNTINNIQGWCVKKWVEDDGGDPDTIDFLELPMPQLHTNLISGAVDAITPPEPFDTIAEMEGAVVLGDAFEAVGSHVLIASWFGSKAWIDANQSTAEAFRDATLKAVDWIGDSSNENELRDLIVADCGVSEAVAGAMHLPYFNDKLPGDLIQPWIDLAVEMEGISTSFAPTEIIHSICPM